MKPDEARIERISRGGGQWWATVVYADGAIQDEPLSVQPRGRVRAYLSTPNAARDGAEGVLGGLVDSWQVEWRRDARGYIDRLNKLALRWLAIRNAAEKVGRGDLVARARRERETARKVAGWVYQTIETYFGGLAALDADDRNRRAGAERFGDLPLVRWFTGGGDVGALPAVAVGVGGSVVTAAAIGAWLVARENDAEEARADLARTLGRMAGSNDPQVRAAGAEMTKAVAAAWSLTAAEKRRRWWPWVLGLAAAAGAWFGRDRIAQLWGGR